jgi:hypothetical protein|tara:strand:+ start:193 stop:1641 length:1449 start_codon:yes stop_codon:yes gene_type:complete
MAQKVTTAQATPTPIEKIDIFSSKTPGKTVSILNGLVELRYYESLLQDSVMATVLFSDSGNTVTDEKTGDIKSAVEALPIVGSEKVEFKMMDNNENKIEYTFRINNVSPLSDETTKTIVALKLVSEEFATNEETRINKRFDGKPSEAVKEILTNFLKTKKDVTDIEDSTECGSIPAQKKPFYALNWLSQRCAPVDKTPGTTAGFFFYETSEGYHFKSIDALLGQEKKKSIIYNETPDNRGQNIPEGYDVKALTFSKDNRVDVQRKLEAGFQSTRLITFNPWNCQYQVLNPKAVGDGGTEESLTKAGKELPKMSDEISSGGDNNTKFSRTTYCVLDTGTLPAGSTQQQIEKSKDENFKPSVIKNQAIMRYNQLYASKVEVTIAGDFSLHAGDAVYFDAPSSQKDTKNDDVDRQIGGLYIISSLCHLVNADGTYTKLNLVRDSFGRTGKEPQTGKPATETKVPGTQPSYQRTVSTASYSTTTTF